MVRLFCGNAGWLKSKGDYQAYSQRLTSLEGLKGSLAASKKRNAEEKGRYDEAKSGYDEAKEEERKLTNEKVLRTKSRGRKDEVCEHTSKAMEKLQKKISS